MAFPSLLFTAGLFLAVSAITRSLMFTYAVVVGYLVLYIVSSNLLSDPELLTVASLLDPFGFSSFAEATRYWTVSERNTLLVPVEGLFLYNKIIWFLAGVGMLGLTHRLFRFEVSGKNITQALVAPFPAQEKGHATVPAPAVKPDSCAGFSR